MAIKEIGQSADSIIGIEVDQTAPTNTQVLAYNSTTKKWVSTAASSGGLTQEQVEDFVAGVCTAGSNISITYDDAAGTLTFAATDTNTQLTQEQIEDFVNGLIVAGSNVTKTYDDAAGTLTIAATDTDTNTQLTQEQVEDYVNGVITAGANVTKTYDDAAGTLTLAATDTNTQTESFKTIAVSGQSDVVADSSTDTLTFAAGSNVTITTAAGTDTITIAATDTDTNTQLTQEQVEDYVDGLIVAGSNVTKTYDDAAGTLTLAATDTNTQTESFKTIAVSGQSDVVADSSADTLTIAAGSNVTITTTAGTDTLTFAATDTNTQLTQEQVEDYVNGLIVGGTNVTATYDDAAGTLTIAATDTDTNTQLTQEQVEDYVNGVITAGSNITKTYDDAAGTLTIAATDTNTQLTQEQVEDYVNGVVTAGSNVTKTYDDAAGTLTLAATDTNTQLTQEQVEDYVNGVITAGANITKTYDDAAGTLTIAAAAGGGGGWTDDGTTVRLTAATDDVGVGTATTNEKLTVDGAVSLAAQTTAPTVASGYGKIYSDAVVDENTVLLLHMDGSDGDQVFVDSSPSAHTVTVAGQTHTDASVVKIGSTSAQFDGTTDYLEIPASSDWDFGSSGDFTVEMWVYFNNFTNHNMLANQWSNDASHTGDWQMFFRNTNAGKLEFFYRSASSWASAAVTVTQVAATTWTHVAVVRHSGTIKFYFNGVADSTTVTDSGQMGDAAKVLRLGRTIQPDHNLDGYVDEFRVSSTARYTAGFTPSTTAFTGTGLIVLPETKIVPSGSGDALNVNSALYVTNGQQVGLGTNTTNEKVTVDGVLSLAAQSSAVTPSSGFSKVYSDEVTDSYTKLLLHCDGADDGTTINDSSAGTHTITRVGTPVTKVDQKQFGSASILFDGTGDYLTTPAHDDFNFGSGDFTIEFFLRYTTVAGNQGFFGQTHGGDAEQGWYFYKNDTGIVDDGFIFRWRNTDGDRVGYQWSEATLGFVVDQWYHVALVRSGTSLKLYLDGEEKTIRITEVAIGSTTLRDPDGVLSIARDANGFELDGYLDEVRISKGIARYTADFTPPTQAFSGTGRLNLSETKIVPSGTGVGLDVHHNPTGLLNDTGGGEVVTFGTGTLVAGKLYYLHTDGAWTEVDADAVATGADQLLGIALGASAATNGVLIRGFFDATTYLSNFSAGKAVYLDVAAASMNTTAPSGSGDFVRIVGYCTTTANVIYFNPSNNWVEL